LNDNDRTQLIIVDKYFLVCASVVAVVGAICDARSRRIPNRLTLTALAVGLFVRGAVEGWSGLGGAIVASLVAGGFFFVFFLAGGMGGGDVKLISAVGAWAGTSKVIPVLVAAGIAGGCLAGYYLIVNGGVGRTLRNTAVLMRHHLSVGLRPHSQINVQQSTLTRVPFGLAIAMGTLFCAGSAFLRR
jgi:prepilin peptidase CpaA